MALEGKLIWKGIDIDNAYVVISSASANVNYQKKIELEEDATYNEDGSLKTEAVYKESYEKVLSGSYNGHIYKDKDSKELNPDEIISNVGGYYTPKHTASAKNDVAQAYEALKLEEAYKDLADA